MRLLNLIIYIFTTICICVAVINSAIYINSGKIDNALYCMLVAIFLQLLNNSNSVTNKEE